ncbi:hypothetical protein PSHT_10714 [Puccinia striiformis]|uniref:Uncharacterized protein n=1 Tax=Puccinia striiformis TaxID=27350 RepID=A0A2S4V7S1_9BASI|nr:hypothetical protein PSHT_10714 [Puccinia striiformis]
MFTAIYVACLLAACAIATPVHHKARGFSGYSQDSAQSARNHDSQASIGPFGGHMSDFNSASSAVSHNSGSNVIGGGLGGSGLGIGNAGGVSVSNSMSYSNHVSASNSLNAGSIGNIGRGVGMIGGAGFGINQQSSFSASSAISNFQTVNSMIGQMQSMLQAGSMSQTVAQQSMQQLAQSLQIVMTQARSCNACFSGQGSQFASVATNSLSFGHLGHTFQSFFQQASTSTASSSSFSNMLSPN